MNDAPGWLLTVIHAIVEAVAFTVGLSAASADLSQISRRPGLMVRALLAILVVVPMAAVLLIKWVEPSNEVAGGVLIAALAIGPVMAFKKAKSREGDVAFALALDLALLILSMAFVPLAVWLVGLAFDLRLHLGVGAVARTILPLQLLPLLLGLAAGRFWPSFAARVEKPLTIATNVALGAVVLVAVIALFKPLMGLGGRTWVFVGAFAALAVVTGHLLGGPEERTRTVVATFSGLRFPGLALVIAGLAREPRVVLPVVFAYVICSVLVLSVYLAVRSTRSPAVPMAPHRGVPTA